jgi:hypothetical protein
LIIDNLISESHHIARHDEEPSGLIDFYTGKVVLALEGNIALHEDVESSSAAGSFGVAEAVTEDVSSERGSVPVCGETIVNVNTHDAIIIEHESYVVIVTFSYGLHRILEGCPRFWVGRGCREMHISLHRHFAMVIGTYPLLQITQFLWDVLVLHTNPLF